MIAPGGIVGNAGGPYKTLSGAVNVHDADVHQLVINDYLHSHGATTTLATAANAGDTSLDLVSAAAFLVGSFVHIGDIPITIEPIHPEVTAIAANVITLDRPLDNDFEIGTAIALAIVDVQTAVGSLAAPISYKYFPQSSRIEHIKRIIVSMIQTSASDDSLFGNLAALTNGVVFRARINGQTGTFTNWKANRDFILDMFDVVYTDKAGPGQFGMRARGDFSELDVAIRLDSAQNDFIEILVQDDLTSLVSFRIKAQGHVEGG